MAGSKEVFHQMMNQGHSAAWDQDWDEAAGYYRAALAEFPNDPQALTSLGLALFEMKNYPAAKECYQLAAAITPNDPIPQEKIARICERTGQLSDSVHASLHAADLHLQARAVEKAIDNWLRVLSLQPDHLSVRTKLAAVYERLGRKEDAVGELIAVASLMQHAGQPGQAVKIMEHAQKLLPANQEVRLAQAMLRGGRLLPRPARPRRDTGPVSFANEPAKAEPSAHEKTAPDEPGTPLEEAQRTALVQMANILFDLAEENRSGNTRDNVFENLIRRDERTFKPGSDRLPGDRVRLILHLSQAVESQTQGDLTQAAVELEHVTALGLQHPAVAYDLGLLRYESDPERAQRALQLAVQHPDFSLAAHLLMAILYQQGGQLPEAANASIQALALADAAVAPPEQADALLSQYDTLTDAQKHTDPAALTEICEAVYTHLVRPGWRDYLLQARRQLPQQPDGCPPLPVAEILLTSHSSEVIELMDHIRALADQGMLRSAHEEAFYALQLAPTYLPLHVLIADLLLKEGCTTQAIQKFLIVADLYRVRGEAPRALRMLRRAQQLIPADISVRQHIIALLQAQGLIEEALEEYTSLAGLYYAMTDLDKARQMYMEALKLAQKANDKRTWGVNLLLKVADIDLQRLNLRQALRVFEQIRFIQPDLPAVRAQIITLNFRLEQEPAAIQELDDYLTLLEASRRRAQAIQFVSDLLVEQANRTDLRRRLADLYIRNNQVPEAVLQLDAAADQLLNTGRHLEAINLLETIISLRPPNVEAYRSALEGLRRDLLRK